VPFVISIAMESQGIKTAHVALGKGLAVSAFPPRWHTALSLNSEYADLFVDSKFFEEATRDYSMEKKILEKESFVAKAQRVWQHG
jgi:hypothetical protein